jgi:hypothetical protein
MESPVVSRQKWVDTGIKEQNHAYENLRHFVLIFFAISSEKNTLLRSIYNL